MNNNLSSADDIIRLVNSFYEKVQKDENLGYIFNDIARVDWNHHLPIMYSFWSGILLGDHAYAGNPMMKHIALDKRFPLTREHFEIWIRLFCATVDELYEGEKAEEAKSRAKAIAQIMQQKISESR